MRLLTSFAKGILQFFILLSYILSSSQAQDGCIGCALEDWMWNTLQWGATGIVGVGGAVANQLFNNQPQDQEKQPGQNNSPDPQPDAMIEIFATDDEQCDPIMPGGARQPGNCAVSTAQIIWPPPCGEAADIERIRVAVNQLAPNAGLRSFTNECGTLFFTASLTRKEIDDLMAAQVGIRFIVANTKGQISAAASKVQKRSPKWPTLRLPKIPWLNDEYKIVTDDRAPFNLAVYSEAPGYKTPYRDEGSYYKHFKNVGKGVTIYWIDWSFFGKGSDFTQTSLRTLYAEDVDPSLGGRPNPPGKYYDDHGGCCLSIVGGTRYGVVKKADLVVVVTAEDSASFISGLWRIIKDLEERQARSELIKGWTVVGTAISCGRGDGNNVNEREAKELIERLIRQYQVVFVAAAGNQVDGQPQNSPTGWPALYAEDINFPIIVVGAMALASGAGWGNMAHYSLVADYLKLTAPGDCWCERDGESMVNMEGTSAAAAMAAGAAADYLSRNYFRIYYELELNEGPELQPMADSVAAKVFQYMVKKAYARTTGGPPCIWNAFSRLTDQVDF